ncbi:hypothetical protein AB0A73_12345 [Glycomyces sp. NPDC047369]
MDCVSVPRNRPRTAPTCDAGADRHRKGDTYLIGGRPADPHDPGPWLWRTEPGYRPDRRTGRHRRGELPDPLPENRPRPRPHSGPVAAADPIERLRELAWTRFLDSSEVLAQAHRRPARRPGFAVRFLNVLSVFVTG